MIRSSNFFCMVIGFVLVHSPSYAQNINNSKQENEKVNIIFDTDMGSDCDDAGALAVLHKFADQGDVDILGVMYSSNANKYGVGVCHAINTYYGRPDLPIGQLVSDIQIGDPRDFYSKEIAADTGVYGHSLVDSSVEVVALYKQLLRNQKDNSVTIVSVGHPVALFLLVNDLEGQTLVNQKVNKWIAMTGSDTIPRRDWNFGEHGASSYISSLLDLWPSPIYFSSGGTGIETGHLKLPLTPETNPVRKAYELWSDALKVGRHSWDQVAVLFAVKPEYFSIHTGRLKQNERLETYWSPIDNDSGLANRCSQFKVLPKISTTELASIIENLMGQKPSLTNRTIKE